MYAIEINDLTKFYGIKEVLKNVSFNIPQNSIYALLGPNGAGKTTLTKCILDLVRIHSGSISIKGVKSTQTLARKKITYFPENFSFFPYYTVEKTLKFYAQMHSVNRAIINNALEEALKSLHIEDIRKQKFSTLSKGQKQRLGLAACLISQAEILLLDEPFTGLDPIAIKELKDLIIAIKGQGKTILINSHILSEVEQICDHMAILHEGKCLKEGTINEIKKEKTLENFFYDLIKGNQ